MVPKTLKIEVWRGPGSSWGRPGGEKSLKSCPGRFSSILAGLGSAKISPNWAKMGPSWSQDGAKIPQVGAKMAILRPSWGQDGHLEPIWGAFLSLFWWSWERSLEKWPKCKIEQHYSVLATFWGLDGGSWEGFWAILAISWALLGDLGHKLGSLGRSWRQVGNFLATCWDQDGQRWPT